jgi:subtilisin family serine protease
VTALAPPAGFLLGPDHPALRGRTGRGVAVAVIDSGVHPGHPHVGGLAGGIAVADDATLHGDVLDRLGHGTAVAAAIHEKAPGAEIHVVRVFHEGLSTTAEALVRALDWAAERGVRLINLSLGTANPAHEAALRGAIARARAAGALVVSAREQGERRWYPGSLPGTVGVVLDPLCPREAVRLSVGDGAVVAFASGYPRPIPGVHPERNLKGVSFAVANTSGNLARLLERRPEVAEPADLLGVLGAGC